jgi:hypothetical protein
VRLRTGTFRAGAAVALGAALMLSPSSGVFAAGGGGLDTSKMPPALRARISGLADLALSTGALTTTPSSSAQAARARTLAAVTVDECALQLGTNVKVNQNCLNVTDPDLQGRAQAQNETAIAVDPTNSNRVVASYNDYRRGDGTCGTSYSQDGGATWNDSTAPNGFTRGDAGNIQGGSFGAPREYWQGGGDTSVAWDSQGNAYLSCQIFNRGQPTTPNPDVSSGFVVYRST